MSGPYRLLFLDLDGTLIDVTEVISVRTLAALHRAQEEGCTIVLSTARNRFTVEPIAAQIGGHTYALLCNGAVITNWETGEVLQRIALSRTTVQEAVRLAHEFDLAPLCFGAEDDGGRTVYTDRGESLPCTYIQANTHRLTYCDDLAADLKNLPISMGVYGPVAKVKALAAGWRARLGPGVTVYDAHSAHYDCWTAYFNSSEVDKARAASTVAQLLGIPQEQTIAIGDHVNDLELLQWAGLGICMGDGHEDVRACADFVTGTFAEDGAAQAIERFVLTRDEDR